MIKAHPPPPTRPPNGAVSHAWLWSHSLSLSLSSVGVCVCVCEGRGEEGGEGGSLNRFEGGHCFREKKSVEWLEASFAPPTTTTHSHFHSLHHNKVMTPPASRLLLETTTHPKDFHVYLCQRECQTLPTFPGPAGRNSEREEVDGWEHREKMKCKAMTMNK